MRRYGRVGEIFQRGGEAGREMRGKSIKGKEVDIDGADWIRAVMLSNVAGQPASPVKPFHPYPLAWARVGD